MSMLLIAGDARVCVSVREQLTSSAVKRALLTNAVPLSIRRPADSLLQRRRTDIVFTVVYMMRKDTELVAR